MAIGLEHWMKQTDLPEVCEYAPEKSKKRLHLFNWPHGVWKMKVDIFDEARRRVSAREVAERNGFHPNWSGFLCCPLHGEKTPSLKLYEDGGWYCFGCGRGGSSIDFAAALYGLTPLDAVRRLNEDFNLALPMDKPLDKETVKAAKRRIEVAQAHRAFEQWRRETINGLCAAFRMAHFALLDMTDLDELTEQEALAIRTQTQIDHWLDILSGGTMDEKMQLFRMRQEVKLRVDKILSNTQMKSGIA